VEAAEQVEAEVSVSEEAGAPALEADLAEELVRGHRGSG
jgi:hypothetical protein